MIDNIVTTFDGIGKPGADRGNAMPWHGFSFGCAAVHSMHLIMKDDRSDVVIPLSIYIIASCFVLYKKKAKPRHWQVSFIRLWWNLD